MSDNSFKSGDRVIELAGLVQSVAILTGVAAGALAGWTAKPSWPAAAVGLFAGGILGLPVGWFIVRCLYRTSNGLTCVVHVGASSIPATIPAALAGSLPTATIIAIAAVSFLGASPPSAFLASVACGTFIGVGFALTSSLL